MIRLAAIGANLPGGRGSGGGLLAERQAPLCLLFPLYGAKVFLWERPLTPGTSQTVALTSGITRYVLIIVLLNKGCFAS